MVSRASENDGDFRSQEWTDGRVGDASDDGQFVTPRVVEDFANCCIVLDLVGGGEDEEL